MSNFDVLVGQNKGRTFIDCDPAIFSIDAQGQLTVVASLLAAINAVVPVGIALPSTTETLPPGGSWAWAEGGSLLRATYPTLTSRYIVTRGAVAITEANPGVVTLAAHGFTTGSCISLSTTGVLPTNLVINTNYYVIYVNANTFRLATSADNARAGTAIDTTGAISAGVHTLWSNPHGINGANSLYLPDMRGFVPAGYGDQAINGRTKSGLWIGAKEEDQGQQITGELDFGANYGGLWIGNPTSSGAFNAIGGTGNRLLEFAGAGCRYFRFDSALSARAGTVTKENRIGVRWIVRIL